MTSKQFTSAKPPSRGEVPFGVLPLPGQQASTAGFTHAYGSSPLQREWGAYVACAL